MTAQEDASLKVWLLFVRQQATLVTPTFYTNRQLLTKTCQRRNEQIEAVLVNDSFHLLDSIVTLRRGSNFPLSAYYKSFGRLL